jgi:hypothetical protein
MDQGTTKANKAGRVHRGFKTPWELSILIMLVVALLSAYGGYKAAKWELEHTVCNNYKKGHSYWHGWLSVKDGVSRCFWLESEYPWRVRHGVALVNGE